MTTIVATLDAWAPTPGITMCADTQVTGSSDFRYPGQFTKMLLTDTAVIGVAGAAGIAQRFLHSVRDVDLSGGEEHLCFTIDKVVAELRDAMNLSPEVDAELLREFVPTVLIGNANGLFVFYSDRAVLPFQTYAAIGSGQRMAFGALAAGAPARRALEIAHSFDAATGREIATLFFPLARKTE